MGIQWTQHVLPVLYCGFYDSCVELIPYPFCTPCINYSESHYIPVQGISVLHKFCSRWNVFNWLPTAGPMPMPALCLTSARKNRLGCSEKWSLFSEATEMCYNLVQGLIHKGPTSLIPHLIRFTLSFVQITNSIPDYPPRLSLKTQSHPFNPTSIQACTYVGPSDLHPRLSLSKKRPGQISHLRKFPLSKHHAPQSKIPTTLPSWPKQQSASPPSRVYTPTKTPTAPPSASN